MNTDGKRSLVFSEMQLFRTGRERWGFSSVTRKMAVGIFEETQRKHSETEQKMDWHRIYVKAQE